MFQQIKVMKKSKFFALPLVALVIAAFSISLMSFNIKTSNLTPQWYEVHEPGITGKRPIGPATSAPDEVNCITSTELDKVCAVRFEGTAPQYLEDLQENFIPHQLAWSEEN
jgi:hypothetical protein